MMKDLLRPFRQIRETLLNIWGGIWKLLLANFIFFLITLPVQVWVMIQFNIVLVNREGSFFFSIGALAAALLRIIPVPIQIIIFTVDAFLLGPVTVGLCYVVSSTVHGKHVWIWPGMKDAALENWKQALPIGIMDLIAVYSFFAYLFSDSIQLAAAYLPIRIVWGVFAILYLCFRTVVYEAMLSVRLTFADLIKDSLIVGILSFARVLLIVLVTLGVALLCTYIDLAAYLLFFYSLISTLASVLISPKIKRYLISGNHGQ